MKTLRELGQAVKAKYPQYADLSDEEVGRRVKAKFPDQYKDYGRTDGHIDRLLDYYNPERGRFSAWWQRGKAESRTKLLEVINQEQLAVIEQGAILEKAIQDGKRSLVEWELFLAQHQDSLLQLQHQALLLNQAAEHGLTVEADQAVRLREEQVRIDLDKRWKEIVQDLDAGDLLAISDLQVVKKLTQELAAARRERHQIEKGDDARKVKKQILTDYDRFILNLEGRINERTEGLVLPANQQTPKRLAAENPQSPGRNQSESAGGEEPLPDTHRRRGRSRKDVSDWGRAWVSFTHYRFDPRGEV